MGGEKLGADKLEFSPVADVVGIALGNFLLLVEVLSP